MPTKTSGSPKKNNGSALRRRTHTINYHLKKFFDDKELSEDSVILNFRITASDGKTHTATADGGLGVRNLRGALCPLPSGSVYPLRFRVPSQASADLRQSLASAGDRPIFPIAKAARPLFRLRPFFLPC